MKSNKRIGRTVLASGLGLAVLAAPITLMGVAAASPDASIPRGEVTDIARPDTRPGKVDPRTESSKVESSKVESSTKPRTDPRGANGTVKIDGIPFQDGTRNEPHVTCGFAVDFFNFDKGQTADITITAQSPTGKRTHTVVSERGVVISDDAAGGAKGDPDATFRFDSAKLNVAGLKAHDRQGLHMRVTVDVKGVQAAGKTKVFWVKPCATATPSTPATPMTKPPVSKPPVTTTPTMQPPVGFPTPTATDGPRRPPTGVPTTTTPAVPSGGVNAGLGGGFGNLSDNSGGGTGSSMPLMLLLGSATLGLGLAAAFGRRALLARRA